MSARRAVAAASLLPAAAHFVPSTLVLGQWAPDAMRLPPALPGGWCRWRGDPRRPAVALTFDDGPDPAATPLFLERLDLLGVRATFFVLGELAERHPELVREAARRGHEVGLHGYRHLHHLARTAPAILADARRGVRALRDAGAPPPRFFRPPYGQISGGSLLAARRLGLETVLWSAWGREWRDGDPRSVARRVAAHLAPGAVVLLHDSGHMAPAVAWRTALEALPTIVETCELRGLSPQTLGELAGPAPAGLERRRNERGGGGGAG